MREMLAAAALLLLAGFQEVSMQRAAGEFDVKITPREGAAGPVGIMALEKSFRGDLVARGSGQMLTWHGQDGVAAYVALEQVTGSLGGREGGFVLAHRGIMNARQEGELSIVIAEDSGTGGLAGIAGTLDIEIRDGTHFYTLEYRLPQGSSE